MIELTQEQSRAVNQASEVPPIAVDRLTNTPYVLVRKDVYDRLKGLIPESSVAGEDELRLMLARSAAANGWEEPKMEVYDRYDEELAKRCK